MRTALEVGTFGRRLPGSRGILRRTADEQGEGERAVRTVRRRHLPATGIELAA
jgi:hypothetical protein